MAHDLGIIDYAVKGTRRKTIIGNYDLTGGESNEINARLDRGTMSLAQARLIAAEWKQPRRAGRYPVAEREATKAAEQRKIDAEQVKHTVAEAATLFLIKGALKSLRENAVLITLNIDLIAYPRLQSATKRYVK